MAFGFRKTQEHWQEQAHFEALKNHESRYQHGRGPCNVFILDTSSSLGEGGFQQMKETFSTIIDEYANHLDIDENVAIIICGRNTKFQRYYSNHYSDIKHCLDDVEFGGLTPLTAAFTLSRACLFRQIGLTKIIGDFHVHPRIILISDGRPTDFTVISDVEDSPAYETEEDVNMFVRFIDGTATDHEICTDDMPSVVHDKKQMLNVARGIGQLHPIFCIPVGNNPDLVTLEFICAQSRGGKIVYPHEARQFAKYSENLKTASLLSFTMKHDGFDREMILMLLACKLLGREFTESDQKDIYELCWKKSLYNSREEIKAELEAEMDDVYQERNTHMPPLGSRVKRGPDWIWGNQDSNGPGTVIGHKDDEWLHVEWDTGSIYPYIFIRGRNDVTVCNEPRILKNEIIAPGCLVKRGSDLQHRDSNDGSIGSVYRCLSNGIIHVRWQNGQKTECSFGYRGKFDLQICDPFSPEAVEYFQDQIRQAELNCSVKDSSAVVSESSPFKARGTEDDIDFKPGKHCKIPNSILPLLTMPKGKYFKNENVENVSTDVEVDGMSNSLTSASDQWLWKDKEGQWNPYPRKINDKINKCYRRNNNSTVIVTIKENTYRVVMAKGIQIDVTTREESEVKIVKSKMCL